MDTYDVAVIGGGPAGSTAAYQLAKRGIKVVLLEKKKLPRYKACGGAVAPRVEKILDFSIEPTIEHRITKILLTVNLKSPFITESPYPFMYMVMRDTFDNYFVEVASNAGAAIHQESPLTELTELPDGYLIRTPKSQVRTKYLIAADGANSITRKLVGAPRFQRFSVAVEREIYGSPKTLQKWHDTIALDFGRLPGGYAWVFPKANNFSIGAGGTASAAKQLIPYYDEMIGYYKDRIDNNKAYISSGHRLPIRVRNEKIVYGRTLFVGDVAGLIEPMTGEGIYYAIRSAQIAVDTIVQSIEFGNDHLVGYQQRIDQEIQPELQVSKALLLLLDIAPGFWIPRLMKRSHPYWKYFYRIFTGEKNYLDLPRKFGPLGKLFFSMLAKD